MTVSHEPLFGFNVLEYPKDDERNWLGEESRKPTFYCDDVGDDASGLCDSLLKCWGRYVRRIFKPSISASVCDRGLVMSDGSIFEGAPGPWMDQNFPPQTSNSETIRVVITQPASEMPENGYPVVFFGHGVGNDKEQSSQSPPSLRVKVSRPCRLTGLLRASERCQQPVQPRLRH